MKPFDRRGPQYTSTQFKWKGCSARAKINDICAPGEVPFGRVYDDINENDIGQSLGLDVFDINTNKTIEFALIECIKDRNGMTTKWLFESTDERYTLTIVND